MTSPFFNRMAVIGVGMVGGSLAMAARRRGLAQTVTGIGRNLENLGEARRLGALDSFSTRLADGVSGADLVVLAAPVGSFLRIVEEIAPHLREGCLVTDVGSVKGDLVTGIEDRMPAGVFYIGGHPIAGGSCSGAVAARPDLFEGAKIVLTPTPRSPEPELARLEAFWERLGGHVVRMDPHEHDRVYAAVSHLPHLVAYALVNAVGAGPGYLEWSGKGFKDTTRIAGSPPAVWSDIFRLNRDNLLDALGRFEAEIGLFRELLKRSDFVSLATELGRAKEMRDRLGNDFSSTPADVHSGIGE